MPRETTTIDLMRHGEPVGGRKYRRQTDDPLSAKGWTQMREAVGKNCPWHALISSPFSRCADFARELSNSSGLPLEVDDRLAEIKFGTWEGRRPDELTLEKPDILNQFRIDPITYAPEGAEQLSGFQQRVLAGWESVLQSHPSKHVMLITHAGVIQVMIAHVLQIPLKNIYRIQVPTRVSPVFR